MGRLFDRSGVGALPRTAAGTANVSAGKQRIADDIDPSIVQGRVEDLKAIKRVGHAMGNLNASKLAPVLKALVEISVAHELIEIARAYTAGRLVAGSNATGKLP